LISVFALWLFRDKLLRLTQEGPQQNIDSLIGETCVAAEDMAVNAVGKAELRGASWTARNAGDKPFAR
jgi:membrane protein implicated in regulation of membrane protease activity